MEMYENKLVYALLNDTVYYRTPQFLSQPITILQVPG